MSPRAPDPGGAIGGRLGPALGFAAAFSVGVVVLRLVVHEVASPFAADLDYKLGCVLGLGGDLVLGLVASLPLLLRRVGPLTISMATLLGAAIAAPHAAGAHYHAYFNRLPGRESLAFLCDPGALYSSIAHHAPPWLVALESVAVGLVAGGTTWLLRHRLARLRGRPAALTLAAGAVLVVATTVTLLGSDGQLRYGCMSPLQHLLVPSSTPGEEPAQQPPTRLAAATELVQRTLASEARGQLVDPRYPLCRQRPGALPGRGARRSVILVILESVAARELALEAAGRPVMPALRRIAARGLHFRRFFASGDRSSQALVGIFSGVAPATSRRLLTHAPLVHLRGFPADLRRVGYHTVYLHGSDLSFEQQRAYLKMVGFAELVEPDQGVGQRPFGWGLEDGRMFRRLQRWIERRRAGSAAPFLAALFTLSTHDPYEVPGVTTGGTDFARFVETLRYLDRELGRFYTWYLREEAPRGTVLLLVGDHSPQLPHPGDPVKTSTGELEYRFRVPLVIAGAPVSGSRRALERRICGHLDLPRTVLALTGVVPALDCYQGRDLLAPGRWPSGRTVVSIAGERLEFFYLHRDHQRWMVNTQRRFVRLFDPAVDGQLRRDRFHPGHPGWPAVQRFVAAYHHLGAYLGLGDHYAPRPPPPRREPTRGERPPLLVSHRGNTRGAGAGAGSENTLAALAAARRAGFRWVELDVRLTADAVAVVAHDNELGNARIDRMTLKQLRASPAGRRVPTLEEVLDRFGGALSFCLEIKPTDEVAHSQETVRQVLRSLRGLPSSTRVIVDSFSRTALSTIRTFSQREVGYDLPQTGPVKDRWLDYAAGAGFHWVYVLARFAGADLVRRAHRRGLKVMVYTIDDPRGLVRFGADPPDGVMTDHAKMLGGGRVAPPGPRR